jgi:VIT1/CCC1 family predicted Fe2+/Mn2+ transporter
VRELITTILDLIGALLLVLAVAVWVAQFSLPAALAAAGLLLLGTSWLIDLRLRRKAGRR